MEEVQFESHLKTNQLEIQNYQQHEGNSAEQARVNMPPEREQELTSISQGTTTDLFGPRGDYIGIFLLICLGHNQSP